MTDMEFVNISHVDSDYDDDTFELLPQLECPKCGSESITTVNNTSTCKHCRNIFTFIGCPDANCMGYAYPENDKYTKYKCSTCEKTYAICPFCGEYAGDTKIDDITGYAYACKDCGGGLFAICNTCGYYAYKYGIYNNSQKFKCEIRKCIPKECIAKNLHFLDCKFAGKKKSIYGYARDDCRRNSFMHMGGDCKPDELSIPSGCDDNSCMLLVCSGTCGKQFTPFVEEKKKKRAQTREAARLLRYDNQVNR